MEILQSPRACVGGSLAALGMGSLHCMSPAPKVPFRQSFLDGGTIPLLASLLCRKQSEILQLGYWGQDSYSVQNSVWDGNV